MKTCTRAHEKISYEAGDCPLCEAVDLTTRLLGLAGQQQRRAINDLSRVRSSLAAIEAGEIEYHDSIQALFKLPGKATK